MSIYILLKCAATMTFYVSGWFFLVAVSWTQDVFCILDGSHLRTWEGEQESLPTVFSGATWLICSQQSCCALLLWEGLGTELLLSVCAWPSQVLKNKSCIYMQAQRHGCHSAGLQWTSGAQMNNFVLNNSSRQPEDPSQLTGSFTAFRGERSTGSTWNIRRGKRVENSWKSLTFASSPTWTGSEMPSPNKGTCFFSSYLPLSLSIQLFTCIPTGMKKGGGILFGSYQF